MHLFTLLLFTFHNQRLAPFTYHTWQAANPTYQIHQNAQHTTPQRLDVSFHPLPLQRSLVLKCLSHTYAPPTAKHRSTPTIPRLPALFKCTRILCLLLPSPNYPPQNA
ncbi:hypothetical protein EDD22DRAFT_194235 [Suillus occidentalis]|nr:hypothetical protein EDD22DRAFT_194235 [Suillus occidentalis]